MRFFTILIAALFYSATMQASDTTMVFRTVPCDQVFKQAAQENKMVFLYFHFDGCGACVKMENTAFRDKALAIARKENLDYQETMDRIKLIKEHQD